MRRKKILLVRVPEIQEDLVGTDLRSATIGTLEMPLGITYLAAAIRQRGNYDVQILDLYAEHYSVFQNSWERNQAARLLIATSALIDAVASYKPYIVGFSAPFIYQHWLVKALANSVHDYNPQIKIFLGGYSTVAPEATMRDIASLDAVFIGESENTIDRAIAAVDSVKRLGAIGGVAVRSEDGIQINDRIDPVKNLDSLAMPAYDMLPVGKYKEMLGYNRFQIVTSRSCPFSCNFCAGKLYGGTTLRLRRPELVLDEIETLLDRYQMEFLAIRDENFNVNKRHARTILKGMIDRNLKIPWSDLNGFHVNSIDEELLDLCKASGCVQVNLAIESASPRVLKQIMNKNVDLEHAKRVTEYCREIDLPFRCFFIIGSPGETKEEIAETLKFAADLRQDHCSISLATPFPGTQYYEVAIRNGYLIGDQSNVLNMHFQQANMQTGEFDAAWLKDTQYDANIRINFLENHLLSGNRDSLEKALEKYGRLADQFRFHVVARLCQGYVHGRLGNLNEREKIFGQVKAMLKDEKIGLAYSRYIAWNTDATNSYRSWAAKAN